MNETASRIIQSARRAWRVQVQLQANRAAGRATSGQEALRAARALRWDGDHLVGDLIGGEPAQWPR